MTYIIVAAGMGTRLRPYTLNCPKGLFHLDRNTTLIGHLIDGIRKADPEAEIVLCTGFCTEKMEEALKDRNVIFRFNPFYEVTNSLSTLWFARGYLDREQVVIIDGDIIAEQKLISEVYAVPVDHPVSLMDSSKADTGDYCVKTDEKGRVIAMAKGLREPSGEYCNVSKLDRKTALRFRDKMDEMLRKGYINEWMETCLNQLVFEEGMELYTKDIAGYAWAEVDDASEMAAVRTIYAEEKK